jgi:hypothetical protein
VNFKGHLIGAVIAFFVMLFVVLQINKFVTVPVLDSSQFLIYLLIFVYFGLMPDLDTDSKVENYTYRFVLAVLIALIIAEQYYYASIIGALSCIPKITSHRERRFPYSLFGMHNMPMGVITAGVVGSYLGSIYGLFAFGGFVTHLVLDGSVVRAFATN